MDADTAPHGTTGTTGTTDSTGTTVAVVLAAGGGSRFEGARHKLLAELDGRPIAERALQSAVDSDIGPVVVVTGATDLDGCDPKLLRRLHRTHHAGWEAGQLSSLEHGLDVARDRWNARAVVVGLADQPFVVADAWRAVAASDAPIAVATYDGARRHPVRLDRSVWPLLAGAPDAGARELIHLRPDLVEEIPCPGSGADIDTVEELRSWQSRSSTNSP